MNSQVVSDPLRASLASLAYTANTATWYSVRELRCCNTTESSVPSSTTCGGGEGAEQKMDGSERKSRGEEMNGRRGTEG